MGLGNNQGVVFVSVVFQQNMYSIYGLNNVLGHSLVMTGLSGHDPIVCNLYSFL